MSEHKDFQDDHDAFKFDDDMNEFLEDSEDLEDSKKDSNAQKSTSRKGKLKEKLSGLRGKFSDKLSVTDKLPGKLKNRRVQLGLVFVVLVIIVYALMGSGSSEKTVNDAGMQATPKQPAKPMPQLNLEKKPAAFAVNSLTPAKEVKPIKVAIKPAAVKKAPALNLANTFSVKPEKKVGVSKAVGEKLSKAQLNQALDSLAMKFQRMNQVQLKTVNQNIDTHYTALSSQNNKLSEKVSTLQAQVNELKKQAVVSHQSMTKLKAKVTDIVNGYVGSFNANGAKTYKAVPRPQKVKQAASDIVTYQVQAVVPGRAWLYGSNGRTLSVGVGTQVKGYGRVMSVNALNGTVILSNGTVFKPGV